MSTGDPLAEPASDAFREFVSQVELAGGLSGRAEAERLTRATCKALGAQISLGQAGKLRSGLPVELVTDLLDQDTAQARSVDKQSFLDRVSTATGASDLDAVERRVRAVCTTLARWAPPGEVDTMSAQLPDDLAVLFR